MDKMNLTACLVKRVEFMIPSAPIGYEKAPPHISNL